MIIHMASASRDQDGELLEGRDAVLFTTVPQWLAHSRPGTQ